MYTKPNTSQPYRQAFRALDQTLQHVNHTTLQWFC